MNGTASTNDGDMVTANGSDVVTAGPPLPRLAAATPLDGRRLSVRFRDGREKIVDLAPALASRRIFIPLRTDDTLFRLLRVSELGDAVEWSGDLDFSAVWLDRLPPVGMANAEFRSIMGDLGLTLDGMAAALEISRRLVADYWDEKPIPAHIALAVRCLSEHASRAPAFHP